MNSRKLKLIKYTEFGGYDIELVKEICNSMLDYEEGDIWDLIYTVSDETIPIYTSDLIDPKYMEIILDNDLDFYDDLVFLDNSDSYSSCLEFRFQSTLAFAFRRILEWNMDTIIKNWAIGYINATYISRLDSLSPEGFETLLDDILINDFAFFDDIKTFIDDFFINL